MKKNKKRNPWRKIMVALMTVGFIPTSLVAAEERIHFITAAGADAIILESDGHFGMVDVGEDLFYPAKDQRRSFVTTSPRFATIERLMAVLDELQIKQLDFIIGTHPHSDHLSSLPQVLAKVKTQRVYLKPYEESRVLTEDGLYDNQWVYDRALQAIQQHQVQLIQPIEEKDSLFQMGHMQVELFNLALSGEPVWDINQDSLITLVTINGKRIFLGADMDNRVNLEEKYGPIIGQVDMMKLNHHGPDSEANSMMFLLNLQPKIAVKTSESPLPQQTQATLQQLKTDVVNAGRTDINRVSFELNQDGILDVTYAPYYVKKETDQWLLTARDQEVMPKGVYQTENNLQLSVLDDQGTLARSQWYQWQNHWYYANEYGNIKRGWFQLDNHWYYTNRDGQRQTGQVVMEGMLYDFDDEGRLQSSYPL